MIEAAADEMRCRGLRYARGPSGPTRPIENTPVKSLLDWFREPITEFNGVLGTGDDNPRLPLHPVLTLALRSYFSEPLLPLRLPPCLDSRPVRWPGSPDSVLARRRCS